MRNQRRTLRDYPIQDPIWPSRRWNKERTEYCDLSGPRVRRVNFLDMVVIVVSVIAAVVIGYCFYLEFTT